MQISDLAAFSRQPTRRDNFSSWQTGLDRLWWEFCSPACRNLQLRSQGFSPPRRRWAEKSPGNEVARSRQLRPGSRQAGQSAFSYKWIEILPKKISIGRGLRKAGQPALPGWLASYKHAHSDRTLSNNNYMRGLNLDLELLWVFNLTSWCVVSSNIYGTSCLSNLQTVWRRSAQLC